MVLLLVHLLTAGQDIKKVNHIEFKFGWKFFASIPTFMTPYAFQSTFFTAFATLKHKTTKNGLTAEVIGKVCAFFVYMISLVIAFELFGQGVESNMLKNISEEKGVFPFILQSIFMIVAVVHIPIIFFIGKECILIVFDQLTRGSYTRDTQKITSKISNQNPQNPDMEDQSHQQNNVKTGENHKNLHEEKESH